MRLILHWILSAVALMIVANLVPGFYIRNFKAAMKEPEDKKEKTEEEKKS